MPEYSFKIRSSDLGHVEVPRRYKMSVPRLSMPAGCSASSASTDATSPVREQRGDVDLHRLPLLVLFRRQHGEGLACFQSVDSAFQQRPLFR